jgi:cytosine/adenosine deaminase-related metal-dependent hydrolase
MIPEGQIAASASVSLRARWLFPIERPPIAGGWVTVVGDTVRDVGTEPTGSRRIDLGDVALLPGLVNAHVHLEFSHLTRPIGASGTPFGSWVRQVVDERRGRGADSRDPRSIERGLAECGTSGTVAVGDIATWPWLDEYPVGGARGAAAETDCRDGVVFLELVSNDPTQAADAAVRAREFLESSSSRRPPGWQRGLSPHAPYSVHPQLLKAIVDEAIRRDAPVAMHLAESREELELIEHGRGGLVETLAALGAWRKDWFSEPRGIGVSLRELARAPRALVIHGNYLDDIHMDWIAAHRDRMSVVYCPRTHQFFGHAAYPLGPLLARGIRVALGTDSRASTPELDLWNDVRAAAATHPEIDPEAILRMATRDAAAALGLESTFGSLAPGQSARWTIVELGDAPALDPYEALFSNASRHNVRA